MPWLTNSDFEQWQAGRHVTSYEKLGAHGNARGTWFAVWAPFADHVSVIGDFNDWTEGVDELKKVGAGLSGLWECYVRGVQPVQWISWALLRQITRIKRSWLTVNGWIAVNR